jgi:hypothetical protein
MKVLCGASLAVALAVTAPVAAAEDFKESPYYPMKVGATWTYKAGDSKFQLRVASYEKIGTTMCARVETVQDGKVVGSEDVFVRDDSVYRIASDGKVINPPVMTLKLQKTEKGDIQPKNGDIWTVDSKADREALKGTFTENGEEVTVPAGKYTAVTVSCEDLDANGAKYSFKTSYAKDVGMVRQEITAGGLKVVIELEKYEPGK